MKDAWKKYYDLLEKFTKKYEPRPDLCVTARAHERCVEIEIGVWDRKATNFFDPPGKPTGKYIWTSAGKRNVSTMRELAQALLDACDFVDENNPVWASHEFGVIKHE